MTKMNKNNNRKNVNRRNNLRKEESNVGIVSAGVVRCEADMTVVSGEIRLELSYDKEGRDFKLAVVGGASQVSAKQGVLEQIPDIYEKITKVDQDNLVFTTNELGREVKSCVDYIKGQIKEAPGVIENIFSVVMKTKRCETELNEYREAHPDWVKPTKAAQLDEAFESFKAEEAFKTSTHEVRQEEALKRERLDKEHYRKLRELEEEFSPVEE